MPQKTPTPRFESHPRAIVVLTLAEAGIDGAIGELVDARGSRRRRVTLHGRASGDNVREVMVVIKAHQSGETR